MLKLKQELNFLLWTDDVPEVPKDFPSVIPPGAQNERGTVNIQCVAHAFVTAGFFMRRGFQITTRAGRAFLLETSPGGEQDNDLLNEIGRHWWVSLDGHGLVDLSLHGTKENPLIYCNRSPGGRWHVAFGDERRKLERFLLGRQHGCFYLTVNKQRATHPVLAKALAQGFPPALKSGIPLSYATILEHCEKLFAGAGESLVGLSQVQAWRKLSQ